MLYREPEEPTTVVVEHTTTPVIERTTIVERDSWWAEPWAISLTLGAIALIGLFAYWALYNPGAPPTIVEHTTINRVVPNGRAEVMTPSSPPPTVIVNPPANGTTVNVTPSSTAQPPVKVDGNGSNDSYDSDSNDNSNSSNDDGNSSDDSKSSTGD